MKEPLLGLSSAEVALRNNTFLYAPQTETDKFQKKDT